MPSNGSSPRGRGTPRPTDLDICWNRFIPARAGNTLCAFVRCRTRSVHPRAGGEHFYIEMIVPIVDGSSPRGRGTRLPRTLDAKLQRFIPARAGNTRWKRPRASCATVHPRAGGEHRPLGYQLVYVGGSSPRGRGTPCSRASGTPALRFIPARAGNTPYPRHRLPRIPVHPRAGGEHHCPTCAPMPFPGSSPRGRGTPDMAYAGATYPRFIPARAGNTRPGRPPRRSPPVHPRAGGEHMTGAPPLTDTSGSSPRGRGTRPYRGSCRGVHRFIPARAGNTASR